MYQINTAKPLNYKSYIARVKGMYEKPVAQTSSALILTIATITFFGFAAIRPTLSTVSELIGELEEKRDIEQKMIDKLSALQTAQNQVVESQDLIQAFDVAIPPDHNLNQLLLKLEYLAELNQVSLTSIRVIELTTFGRQVASKNLPDAPTPTLPSVEIRVGVAADQQSLKDYLHDLSQLDRVFDISSASFTFNQDEDFPDLVTMSVSFKTFWAPTNQSSPAPQNP